MAMMTTMAVASSGVNDRGVSAGGSDDDGGRDDLAEDFLPIILSFHFTVSGALGYSRATFR
jgi:hypothetical protein